MRVQNSVKNISIAMVTQVVSVLLGFLSRKIFIDSLGAEYLGINGLLTSVISMLSLVEGGIGASITYNLYKPLAENDEEKVTALIQLYKKLYSILAIFIFITSMCLYPFLGYFIKGGDTIKYMGVVYFIFVIKNIVSYLNAHKWSLINADQKQYVLSRVNLIFNTVMTLSKMAILILTQNYILYLVIELAIFLIQNIYNGRIVTKSYPYIKTKEKLRVGQDLRENLITNVKSIFLHKIGTYCVYSTDSLLISAFVGVSTLGIYSNYTLVTTQLTNLLSPILSGIEASVGNLIATESKEKNFKIFKVIYFINFWIYSFSIVFLYNLLEPFISWCFGGQYLLDKFTLIVILINFYVNGLKTSNYIFKSKAGIYKDDRYMPLLESVINLGASIILAKYLGLAGILLGTTISNFSITFWNQPRLIYKKIFKVSLVDYFNRYIIYVLVTLVALAITTPLCNLVPGIGFISLVIKGLITVIVPNLFIAVLFFKTEEFKYILGLVQNFIPKIKTKILRREINQGIE